MTQKAMTRLQRLKSRQLWWKSFVALVLVSGVITLLPWVHGKPLGLLETFTWLGGFIAFLIFILDRSQSGGDSMSLAESVVARMLAKQDEFNAVMKERFERDEIDLVISECSARLAARPNDIFAHWWLAKAGFLRKDFALARRHFLRVVEIDPGFKKVATPYLQEIENQWKPKLVS